MPTTWSLPRVRHPMCTRCGLCLQGCSQGALYWSISQQGSPPLLQLEVRADACTGCGTCEDLCPQKAIDLTFIIAWANPASAFGSGGEGE